MKKNKPNIFSKKSEFLLNQCDNRLIKICRKVLELHDISIISGHRGNIEQNALFDAKRTRVKWPKSKHNKYPSMAVDIAPYPIDWKDRERFVYVAGLMQGVAHEMGIKLRWGGDWDKDNDFKDQKFNDLGHFELTD